MQRFMFEDLIKNPAISDEAYQNYLNKPSEYLTEEETRALLNPSFRPVKPSETPDKQKS